MSALFEQRGRTAQKRRNRAIRQWTQMSEGKDKELNFRKQKRVIHLLETFKTESFPNLLSRGTGVGH